MKYTAFILTLLITTFTLSGFTGGEDELYTAIKTGNAKLLVSHFKSTVELTVLNSEQVSSKAQAEQILKNFFAKNPPKSFKVIHQGTSKLGIQYKIGTLTTAKGNFRITMNSKVENGKELIEQFRIDKD